MPEDIEYFRNKRSDRVYVSKVIDEPHHQPEYDSNGRLVSFQHFNRPLRFMSRVFDSDEIEELVKVKDEIVLHKSPAGRQEIRLLFYEDTREVKSITIQRYVNGNPKKHCFTFSGAQLDRIYEVLLLARYGTFETAEKARLDDKVVAQWLRDSTDRQKLFADNLDLVVEIVENQITRSDVTAVAYRKHQLEVFRRLLQDKDFFDSMQTQ